MTIKKKEPIDKKEDIVIPEELDNILKKDPVKEEDIKPVVIKKEPKPKPPSDIQLILDKLELDNELNKKHTRQKRFNKVFYEIYHKEDYNLMADLIEFPTTENGNKYLFTIVDLYTQDFDCEPVKNKESKTVLDAMLKIFKRKTYIKQPYSSINTDGGSEFKSVFHKWIFDNGIYHKTALPYRHKQQSVVESLNKQLTKFIMLYLNKKTIEVNNNKPYTNWEEILPDVIKELNLHRDKLFTIYQKRFNKYKLIDQNIETMPKFKTGDTVHFKLDYPENADMSKASTHNFRAGDYMYSQETRKIVKVIFMNTFPWYRYILEGKPGVSYSEYELRPATVNYSTFKVKAIIDEKTEKKIKYFLVWWKGDLKKDSTWETEKQLLEDGLKDYIDEFKKLKREKLTKERDKFNQKQKEKYEKGYEKKLKKQEQNKQVQQPTNTRYNLRNRNN